MLRPSARRLLLLCCVAGSALAAHSAQAACNLIPGTAKTFDAALGATNRPFAAPGERLEVRLRACDASPGFLPSGSDHVVTIVFKAPGGTNRIVALATDCSGIDTAGCATAPGVTSAVCQTTPGLETRTDLDLGDRRIVFPFPDTDAELGAPNDDLTLSGPAVIAVTPRTDPLPCQLATQTCAAQSGLMACVDELYFNDGACGATARNDVFPHFTALPLPNKYSTTCFQGSPPCTATATELRIAEDADGNLLMPVVWQGVLTSDQGLPVPRLVRTRIASPLPFVVPNQTFVTSYSPEGGVLPPILEPQLDPTVSDPNVVTLFGSVDAPYTTIRIARRHGTCVGGAVAGQRCARNFDCKGGACARSCVDAPATLCPNGNECTTGACGELFDLTPLVAGGGPLVVPRTVPQFCQLPPHQDCTGNPGLCTGPGNLCVSYAMEAQSPVPLDGLTASATARTFAFRESIDGVDRNGDGDTDDSVVTLRSRASGEGEPLDPTPSCGLGPEADGRAVQRVSRPPFAFPALAVEGDVLAFLENEFAQNLCDENDDGDTLDGVLRIFRLGGGETVLARDRAVDGASKIDGAPIAVSGGRVFVRTSEPDNAARGTVRGSLADGGGEATFGGSDTTLSADGRFVAFTSLSSDLVGPGADTNAVTDAFRHDLATGATVRVSIPDGGVGEADTGTTGDLRLSRDGRYVVFTSPATNLLGPGMDGNGGRDAFVHDTVTLQTRRVNVAFGGGESAPLDNARIAMSDDGRFVAFVSAASDLLPPGQDTNGVADVFVRDMVLGTTERVSVGQGGVQGDAPAGMNKIGISGDGNVVAFESDASNLLPGAGGPTFSYLRDRAAGVTESLARLHPDFGGGVAAGDLLPVGFSFDGRVVAFLGGDAILGIGEDTNGKEDVFVRDRQTGITERVSVASDGSEATGGNFSILGSNDGLSDDGRYVVFQSDTTNLVPGPVVGFQAYVHDRVTGTTRRASVGADGAPTGDNVSRAAISGDGTTVAFETGANLLGSGGDTNATVDAYVRGIDAADPEGVDALLFPDGVLDDTVLEVIDATSGAITTLCEADEVSVAAGNAAFLRPESTVGTASCPGGSLNVDADTDDLVVQLSIGAGPVQNLALAASAVKLSPTLVAALADEAAQNATSMNGDGDATDTVLQVRALGAGAWTNVARAADALVVSGNRVAFLVPEAQQNASVLNGDGDALDRVVHVYEHGGFGLRNLGQAGEEMVLGEPTPTACGMRHLLAFRTSEAAQGDGSLNGDGDTTDGVLQVYDIATGTLTNVGQTVTPCRLEICDPTRPYKVEGASVKFLTLETEQNQDRDGNGVIGGLVLQRFDACSGVLTVIGPVDVETRSDPLDTQEASEVFTAPGGRCSIVPAIACDPASDTCADGTFCSPATLVCTTTSPGACATNDDCPSGSLCQPQPVVVALSAADTDGDGVSDDLDDCPITPDPLQSDLDGDGVGDACDLASHGCSSLPLAGCKAPVEDLKAVLVVKNATPDKGDLIDWKWNKGEGTVTADFGDPRTTSNVRLCLYDGPARTLIAGAIAPAGGTCAGKACWKATGTKGFQYANKVGTPSGLQVLKLKAGTAGKAAVAAKGKGMLVDVPPLPVTGPVLVQLSADGGACFEAEYRPAAFQKNDATQLKAKGGAPLP
ncbi:MAG TPA: hypothetical protein VGR62_23525 [Candidatus Binatia bacterium]|nr:hypothetical protein [Candidatus Binatia bacterium]